MTKCWSCTFFGRGEDWGGVVARCSCMGIQGSFRGASLREPLTVLDDTGSRHFWLTFSGHEARSAGGSAWGGPLLAVLPAICFRKTVPTLLPQHRGDRPMPSSSPLTRRRAGSMLFSGQRCLADLARACAPSGWQNGDACSVALGTRKVPSSAFVQWGIAVDLGPRVQVQSRHGSCE